MVFHDGRSERTRVRSQPASDDVRRVRRPGADPRQPAHRHRRRARPRRTARPRAAVRPARPRQDHARAPDRRRHGRRHRADLGPGPRRAEGPRRHADAPASATRCCSSTRSTGCRRCSRSTSTRRWRTTRSTSCSIRGRAAAACASACSRSRWSAPPRAKGLLTAAFRSRFGIVERLEPYPSQDIEQILLRAAVRLRWCSSPPPRRACAPNAAAARRAWRCASCAACATWPRCSRRPASTRRRRAKGLQRLRIDHLGLEELDRKLLRALVQRGDAIGLKTLAAMLDEAEDTHRGRARAPPDPLRPAGPHAARPRRHRRAPTNTSACPRRRRSPASCRSREPDVPAPPSPTRPTS
jgi:hypothetical protein